MSDQLPNELPIDDNSDSSFSSSGNSSDTDNETGDHHEEHEIDEDNGNSNNNRTRSWIWSHYIRDENTKKARCNYCKVLIAVNKGSTSGMIKHAKSKHRVTKNQEIQNKQLTLQESILNNSETIVSLFIII
jgi:hypothetical protein